MSLKDYIKSSIGMIVLNIVSLIALLVFLFSVGNTLNVMLSIALVWIGILSIYTIHQYKRRKAHFEIIHKSIAGLDKRYLISEVLKEPPFVDSVPYYYLLKKASKSMREEINEERIKLKNYKEYIEQWIHEVKTPISLIKLIEENNRTQKSSAVLMQLEEIDRYVEQALFYARSEDVEKDYLIKEIGLEQCINSVITKNKQGFILNNIDIEIHDTDKTYHHTL